MIGWCRTNSYKLEIDGFFLLFHISHLRSKACLIFPFVTLDLTRPLVLRFDLTAEFIVALLLT